MKAKLRKNQDFWAGLMFILVGSVAIIAARSYPFGSTLQMGPGYFPIVLSGIMIFFGLIIMTKGLHRSVEIPKAWPIRPLIVLPFSLCLYGILMEAAGFLPALIVLIFVSAASGREFHLKEVIVLTVVLTTMAWVIFIWGIGLHYPMFLKFW